MAEPVKLGAAFGVNTQTTNFQFGPVVTNLASGGFVVTWYDYSGTLGDTALAGVKAQMFDAAGAKQGSEFLVNMETASFQGLSTVTGLGNGGFVITWQDHSGTLGDSSGTAVKAQLFGSNGAKVGSEFLVNSETANDQRQPTVTGLANGGFVVTWNDSSVVLGDVSTPGIAAQIFSASGAKVGSEFLVNTETNLGQFNPEVTGLEDGTFVVTWLDTSGTLGDNSGSSIKAKVISADGAIFGNEFLVNTQIVSHQTAPRIASLSDGGFVITWQDSSGSLGDADGTSIKAQRFGAGGVKQGGEFLVNTETAHSQFRPDIASRPGGGFVITWFENSGTPGTDTAIKVRAQAFDAAGAKNGSELVVDAMKSGEDALSVTCLDNGNFVITWTNENATTGDDSGSGVNGQIYTFSAGGNTGNGTTGDDVLKGTAGDDQLAGLAGNDTLSGLAGNDRLDGGTGNDRMIGGIGDDTYIVDVVGDRVSEKAGQGTDMVQTALARYALGANVENLTFTGNAAHKGIGNVLVNHLIGGGGNDLLDGRAGADMLEGGKGNDTYYVDVSGDLVIELAGEGSDRVFSSVSYTLAANIESLTLTGSTATNGTGNGGNNVITGNGIANALVGLEGNDTLIGLGGDDALSGGAGNDRLLGGAGADMLDAGLGSDVLTGGTGADKFVFLTSPNAARNIDKITDFVSGTDKLVFSKSLYTGFAAIGAIGTDAFYSGDGIRAAQDAGDRFIYNTANGALLYDADGTGAGKAVMVAVLAGQPALAFSDILIVA